MKTLLAFGLAFGLVVGLISMPVAFAAAKDKKAADRDPVIWGMLDHNDGCVIFREYQKTKNRFYGVAETSKTFGMLDVIEARNYTPPKKTWVEDQDGMDDLQRMAVKDRLEFVKIPDKYTDKQLDKARTACKEPSTPTPPAQ